MASTCSSQATIDITITVDCKIWIPASQGDPQPGSTEGTISGGKQTIPFEGKEEHDFRLTRKFYFGTGVDATHADFGFYLFAIGLPDKITVHDVTFNPSHPAYTAGTTKALDEFDVVVEGKVTVAQDYAGEDAAFQLELELNTGETSVTGGRTLIKRSP